MKEYRDFYFRKAKTENYPARSVYKLKEIDDKFHILRRGMKILDLGAAPGSWTLLAAEKTGAQGIVVACDLAPARSSFPAHVCFMQADVLNPQDEFKALLADNGPFDLVLSDMAPATTGSKSVDQARSLELATTAFEVASEQLKTGGSFVAKIFMGPDMRELMERMRKVFANVKTFKPKSSRAESKETFFTAFGFRGKNTASN